VQDGLEISTDCGGDDCFACLSSGEGCGVDSRDCFYGGVCRGDVCAYSPTATPTPLSSAVPAPIPRLNLYRCRPLCRRLRHSHVRRRLQPMPNSTPPPSSHPTLLPTPRSTIAALTPLPTPTPTRVPTNIVTVVLRIASV
jgi:hypothetical protein